MKRTATAFAIVFGLTAGYGIMPQSVSAHENSTASQVKDTGATSTASDSSDATQAKKSKESKHEKKERKHHAKNGQEVGTEGDGSPLTKLGTHKRVDGGFDFENSKQYHTMGNQ